MLFNGTVHDYVGHGRSDKFDEIFNNELKSITELDDNYNQALSQIRSMMTEEDHRSIGKPEPATFLRRSGLGLPDILPYDSMEYNGTLTRLNFERKYGDLELVFDPLSHVYGDRGFDLRANFPWIAFGVKGVYAINDNKSISFIDPTDLCGLLDATTNGILPYNQGIQYSTIRLRQIDGTLIEQLPWSMGPSGGQLLHDRLIEVYGEYTYRTAVLVLCIWHNSSTGWLLNEYTLQEARPIIKQYAEDFVDYVFDPNYWVNKVSYSYKYTTILAKVTASAIPYLLRYTKTYTNSTWNTNKTWYIKTTFTLRSTSWSSGNVVNYEPMLRERYIIVPTSHTQII